MHVLQHKNVVVMSVVTFARLQHCGRGIDFVAAVCFAEVLCRGALLCARTSLRCCMAFSCGTVRTCASVEKCMFVPSVACKSGCVFVCLLIFDIDAF